MKCKEVYHEICDSLDQDLNSPRCREIKKHLEECPDCKEYLSSMKKMVVLYRTVPAPQISTAVSKNLSTAINSAWQISAPRRRKTRRR
jgi:predicted anti-sigma-YlaC factor YlaD